LVFASAFAQTTESSIKFESRISKLSVQNPNEAIKQIDSLLQYADLNDTLMGILYYRKGHSYQNINNYQASLPEYDKALGFFKSTKNNPKIIDLLASQASSNAILGNRRKAIVLAFEALDLAKKIKNDDLIASSYSTVAHVYYTLEDWDNVYKYLTLAYKLEKKNNNIAGLASTYNNLASVYQNRGQYEKALYYYNFALENSFKMKNNIYVMNSYENIAQVYTEIKQYDKALEYLNKLKKICDSLKIPNSTVNISISRVYQLRKDYKNEKIELITAKTIEEKVKNFPAQKRIAKKLLENAINTKDFQSAIKYKNEIDSLDEQIAIKDREDTKVVIENQKKILLKEKELEISKERNRNIIITSVILFFLFFFGLLFLAQRTKNKALKANQHRLVLEQKVLQSQMNPHFIFNVLSAIQNSLLDNNSIKSAGYLANFAKLIRQNFNFIQKEKISLADDLDALDNYIKTQQFRFNDSFDYKIDVEEEIDIETVFIPPMLLQPFVENAIEHGLKPIDYKGFLEVKIQEIENKIHFTITDNGVGYLSNNDAKEDHAIAIFKKRLALMGNNDESSFEINNNPNASGTQVKFCIKND
jgi:tetratricopeptide (TPR) repeat protein